MPDAAWTWRANQLAFAASERMDSAEAGRGLGCGEGTSAPPHRVERETGLEPATTCLEGR